MRFFRLAALLHVVCVHAHGELITPPPGIIPEGWAIFVVYTPIYSSAPPDIDRVPGAVSPGYKPLPGFEEKPFGQRQMDVSGAVKSAGVPLPENASAIVDEAEAILTVIAPREVAAKVAALFTTHGPVHLRIKAELVSVETKRLPIRGEMTYSRLRESAGDSWRQIDSTEVLTTAGWRTAGWSALAVKRAKAQSAESVRGRNPEPTESNRLGESELGVSFEVTGVPIRGRVNLDYTWFRRYQQGKRTRELDITSQLRLIPGRPTVVAHWKDDPDRSARNDEGSRTLLLIVEARVLSADLWPISVPAEGVPGTEAEEN